MSQHHQSLANKLRQLREQKNWTLKEAAEVSGVHLSYISAIETNRRNAGRETLEKLVDAYSDPQSAGKLYAELLEMKTNDEGRSQSRKDMIQLVLMNQGIFGRLIFKAICLLNDRDLECSKFEVLNEPETLEIDWKHREVGGVAKISLGGTNYRIRLMISEDKEPSE